jgi:hypothetical protein
MDESTLAATSLTVLAALGLLVYRLLWAASAVSCTAGRGGFSRLPKGVRRWLFGDHNEASNGWRESLF